MTAARLPDEFVAEVKLAHADGVVGGEPIGVAFAELVAGSKTSHWIWYVFPQIQLGASPISKRFSVRQCADITALLDDPITRFNLNMAFGLAAGHVSSGATVASIFGRDVTKVRSSAVLFEGFLSKHPRQDCSQLQHDANIISTAAIREVGDCFKTLRFLDKC